MPVDRTCRNEIFSIIQSQLNNIPIFLREMAKNKAREGLINFHRNVPQQDLELGLSDYLAKHPEVKTDNPMIIPLIPDCAYQYSMQELLDCLWEIKDQI